MKILLITPLYLESIFIFILNKNDIYLYESCHIHMLCHALPSLPNTFSGAKQQ